jgi:hypothetical protein
LPDLNGVFPLRDVLPSPVAAAGCKLWGAFNIKQSIWRATENPIRPRSASLCRRE